LDPHFRPNVVDSFDLTIQRQLANKVLLEVGYIGRRITHEYQPINLNAVPHMMTLGGQSFAKAYAALEQGLGCATSFNACGAAIPTNKDKAIQKAQQTAYANSFAPQPFFETALANTGYCTGFTSCTAAVVFNESGNLTTQSVWSMWSDLDAGGIGGGPICSKVAGCANANGTTATQNQQTTLPGFNFARSMLNSPINTSAFGSGGQMTSGVGLNASIGHGNYNAGFASLKVTSWHGLTFQENFTYSKALGTGAFVQATSQYTANDAFNLDQMYGVQNFDRKFVFNTYLLYEPPFYRSQQGFIGRVLGGWSIAPIFAAGSGAPLYCNTNTDAQSYGSADGNGFFTNEQCHFTGKVGSIGVHNSGGSLNVFGDPAATFDLARPPILGLDTRDQGVGPTRGLPYWNMDLKVAKELKILERVSASFEVVFVNVFNHVQFFDPGCPSSCGLDPTNPDGWGSITAQGNNPRQMQFGIRLKF